MGKNYSTVLVIAGSDSVGGAGIQADIKTCTALGVYAATAVTALTSQNTCGVTGVLPTPPLFLKQQLSAVLSDFRPDAIKIGMIPDEACARTIAEILSEYGLGNVVTDPVMIATSGDALSTPATMDIMKSDIFPRSAFITPNLPEAEALLGRNLSSENEMPEAALALCCAYNCSGVVLKGGHSDNCNPYVTDYVAQLENGTYKVYEFSHPRVVTNNTHGTGCSLSSAIASHLALGFDPLHAAARAISWLVKAIESGKDYCLGKGHGPVNHMFNIRPVI